MVRSHKSSVEMILLTSGISELLTGKSSKYDSESVKATASVSRNVAVGTPLGQRSVGISPWSTCPFGWFTPPEVEC